MKPLRILSIGAGAIGTYIGGSLTIAGNDVVFLEREETAKSIKSLHLTLLDQSHTISQPVFVTSIEDALSMGTFDIALFALKSFDTIGALQTFKLFASQLPPILCLQNGVENEAKIGEILGEDNVIPATVTSSIGKTTPGSIILERFRGIGLSSLHPLSIKLQHAFNEANLNVKLYNQPDAMKWSKMLTNLVSNATSAILALPPHEIFSHSKLFRLELAQLHETLAIMKANEIPVVDLPGTPVRLLTFAATLIPPVISRPLLKRAVAGGRGEKMPSFYLDLQSSRLDSEVEFLNGAVVRWGEKMKIPTPVNTFLTRTLLGMVWGEIPKDKYKNNSDQFIRDYAKSRD